MVVGKGEPAPRSPGYLHLLQWGLLDAKLNPWTVGFGLSDPNLVYVGNIYNILGQFDEILPGILIIFWGNLMNFFLEYL